MESNMQSVDRGWRISRICLIAGVILLILAGALFGYYKWRQSRIVLDTPQGYSVSCEENAIPRAAARSWFESLAAQHQQAFINNTEKINRYEVESVRVLTHKDKLVVQIDFRLALAEPDSPAFADWSLGRDEDEMTGQWVVTFGVSEPSEKGAVTYTAERIQRPAGYDLEQYTESGQAEKDELEQALGAPVPYDKTQYTYRIADGVCAVSYDAGATWIDTPLPVDQIDYYVNGHFKTNELSKGSYVIAPEKTAILYGGFNSPLTCLYSDDRGKTWNTSTPNEALRYCHIKFCSFPTQSLGYIVVGSEKTMSWEGESVYKTADGGKTWTYTGEGARMTLMASAGFVAEDVGFIAYPYMEGAESMLYRTADAGAAWAPVTLDIDAALAPYFTVPQTPFLQDGKLVLIVGEGADSDYEAVSPMGLRYVSDDMGVTWTYDKMVEIEAETEQEG